MNDHQSGYERRDTSIRTIFLATLVAVVAVIIAVVTLYDFFITTREAVFYEQALKPDSPELLELRRVEDSVFTSYELVDSTNRTYRVPIVRAMELLAAESAGTAPRK